MGLKGSTLTRIATRFSRKSFELEQKEFNGKYSASLPATLMLLDVKNREEYTYNLVISYTAGNRSRHILQDNVSVVVFGKYKCSHHFFPPTLRARLHELGWPG